MYNCYFIGLYGENNDESTTIDVVIGTTEDFMKHVIALYYEKDEAKKAELTKDVQEVKLPAYLNILEDILKQNDGGNGFFAGKKVRNFIFHQIVVYMAILDTFHLFYGVIIAWCRVVRLSAVWHCNYAVSDQAICI